MARRLNLTAPDIGTPDGDRPDGFYLDEGPGDPGTPILADLKNDIYYFFNKMMDEAGITYNNVVDTQTLSQYFNALLISANKPETETVSASQTLNLNSANKIFQADTSGGDFSLVVPNPDFIGQEIWIYSSGTSKTFVNFPGKIPSGDVPVTDKKVLKLKAISLTEYFAPDVITAYFQDGGWDVYQTSGGSLRQEFQGVITSGTGIGTENFPVPYIASKRSATGMFGVSGSGTNYNVFETTGSAQRDTDLNWRISPTPTSNGTLEFIVSGRY